MGGGDDILWWIVRSVSMGVLVELQYVTNSLLLRHSTCTDICSSH